MIIQYLGRSPILLTYDPPPIPQRQFDYCALFPDLYDGAPDAGPQLIGYGPSPEAAVIDLLEQELSNAP